MANWISSKLKVAETFLQQIDQQAAESLGKNEGSRPDSVDEQRSPAKTGSVSLKDQLKIRAPDKNVTNSNSSSLRHGLKLAKSSSSSHKNPDSAVVADTDWTELLSSPNSISSSNRPNGNAAAVSPGSSSNELRRRERARMATMSEKKRFQGKVAIVTASTQGIGFGIAQRLGLEGTSVVISSRKQNNVDEAVEKLRAQGVEVLGLVCHVSNPEQRKELIDKTVQKYGNIDIVVSNAAANPSVDSILHTKESVLDKMWDINVKTSVLLLQAAAPHLRKGSSVVFISSIAGYHPKASMAMYGVTKTALLGLTKALASEMAPDTRVNCVAPGFVPTHFADFLTRNQAVRKEIEQQTLLNRLGTVGDMAGAVAFLASEDASYITGETIIVAGGMPSRL